MPVLPIGPGAAEPQTLDEIRAWYRGIVEALLDQRAMVQNSIRTESPVALRFVGMTDDELDAHYQYLRRELDRLTLVTLVASAEAAIKDDYHRRVRKNLKDPLSRAYQAWHKTLSTKKKMRPDFDERGILAVLKKTRLVDNHTVGQFRECLLGRHWIGHGRNFRKPIAVDRLDPEDVYARAQALLHALSLAV